MNKRATIMTLTTRTRKGISYLEVKGFGVFRFSGGKRTGGGHGGWTAAAQPYAYTATHGSNLMKFRRHTNHCPAQLMPEFGSI